MKPRVEIRYCPRCRWLPRACWIAQELLVTFEEELGGVTLAPAPSGVFEVRLDDVAIFSRAEARRLPDARELKLLIRDRVCPEKDLGHSERRDP